MDSPVLGQGLMNVMKELHVKLQKKELYRCELFMESIMGMNWWSFSAVVMSCNK
jgi:hypothetical protein